MPEEEKRLSKIEGDIRQLETSVKLLEKADEQNQKTHKEFFNRLESIDKSNVEYRKDLEYLVGTVKELKQTVTDSNTTLRECINDVKKQIQEINMKPAKKWEKATWEIVKILIGAIIGGVIVFFGGSA